MLFLLHFINLFLAMDKSSTRQFTPVTNSSTLEQESTDKISEGLCTLRLTFIQRLLSNVKAANVPPKLSLQPIRHTPIQSKKPQEKSARDILKKAIIIDPQTKFAQDKTAAFLMRGKMVTGIRRPIQNQMASLLEGINERIKLQLSKQQKTQELPLLDEKQQNQKTASLQKLDCGSIFKNLKGLRLKRVSEQSQQKKLIKLQHLQQRGTIYNNETFGNNRSHSQNCNKQQARPIKATISNNPQTLCPPLLKKMNQINFKKGYLAYDEEAKHFLETNRSSMRKLYIKVTQKTKQITANAFLVLDCSTLTPIAGKNVDQSIQIASISKVMTCYLCLLICKKYSIDIYTHQIRISQKAAQTPGTTAELQSGDLLTVFDLLMALMLPSGNDASVAIAQGMGKLIQKFKKRETKKNYFETFVAHMNLLSKELELDQTWNNSSGLSINPNFSTAEAIAILTSIAVKDETFNAIVNTKVYEVEVSNEKYGLTRKILWRNTNKLLGQGWQGVKTGTTQNAGHCLMARKGNILVSVFNCETLSRRFTQCVRLYERFVSSQNS